MKKIVVFFVLLFCRFAVFAHSPLLSVEANGDGTIYVEGGFSNGAGAAGVKLYLKDKETGEVLWDGVFPENGSINLPIPNVPYTVTFDGGPGHLITKDGPEPPNGFGAENGASEEDTDTGSAGGETESGADGEPEDLSENSAEENEADGAVQEDEDEIEEELSVISAAWNPVDTAQTLPPTGVSFIVILTLIFSAVNLILMIFILKKKSKK